MQTRGYTTGGTVHIIINNQIGFTTSDPSATCAPPLYCTDIVKMVESPVLHVNGDDPKPWCWPYSWPWNSAWSSPRTWWWTSSAFRKLGHNEQDTPMLTQPLMYKKIAQHPGTRKLYADKLAAPGPGSLGDDMAQGLSRRHGCGPHTVDPVLTNFKSKYAVDWSPLPGPEVDRRGDTAIPLTEWKRLAEKHHHHARQRHAAPCW